MWDFLVSLPLNFWRRTGAEAMQKRERDRDVRRHQNGEVKVKKLEPTVGLASGVAIGVSAMLSGISSCRDWPMP